MLNTTINATSTNGTALGSDMIYVMFNRSDFGSLVYASDEYMVLNASFYLKEEQANRLMAEHKYSAISISVLVLVLIVFLLALVFNVQTTMKWMFARKAKKCQVLLLILMCYAVIALSIVTKFA